MSNMHTQSPVSVPRKTLRFSVAAGVLGSAKLAVLIIGAVAMSCAQPQTLALSAPQAFSHQRTFPVVSRGYMLSFSRTITTANASNVLVTSLTDGRGRQVPVSLPGSVSTVLLDGSVNESDHLILVGQTTSMSNSGDVLRTTGFVAEVDFQGKVKSVVDTGKYTPARTCASGDGTYWTLGAAMSNEGNAALIAGDDTNMLRNYSPEGKLLHSYMPRSSFRAASINLLPSGQTFGATNTKVYLSCSSSSVGVYIGKPVNLWTEVRLGSGRGAQWRIRQLPGGTVTGLTHSLRGDVYASVDFANETPGLYRLDLSAAKAIWVRLPTDTSAFSNLLGREGDSLVHLIGSRALAGAAIAQQTQPNPSLYKTAVP